MRPRRAGRHEQTYDHAELPLPAGLGDQRSAFSALARAHKLALASAQVRGIDPDAPGSVEGNRDTLSRARSIRSPDAGDTVT